MRIVLMHKNQQSVSSSGFPLDLSLPCFPLAPMFSYSLLWGREFPSRLIIWSWSHLFTVQGLSGFASVGLSLRPSICVCNKVL